MVDENAVSETRQSIKSDLSELADKLGRGENEEFLVWVIQGVLACAHRPLRYHSEFGGSGHQLPPTPRSARSRPGRRAQADLT